MIAEAIKLFRSNLQITQTELSEKLGVASNTVSQWEQGERTPRTSMLPKLAETLGCSIQDLFDEKSQKGAS